MARPEDDIRIPVALIDDLWTGAKEVAVYAIIARAIQSGKEALIAVGDAALQLGVSDYRGAIRKLEAAGWIRINRENGVSKSVTIVRKQEACLPDEVRQILDQ